MDFTIEPHGSRIVFITDPAPISAIGVNDCLCPELEQVYENGVLNGTFVKPGETICLFSETPVEAICGGTISRIEKSPGLYAFTQEGESLRYQAKAC